MGSLGYETINLDEPVPVEYGHRNAHTLARPQPPSTPASASAAAD